MWDNGTSGCRIMYFWGILWTFWGRHYKWYVDIPGCDPIGELVTEEDCVVWHVSGKGDIWWWCLVSCLLRARKPDQYKDVIVRTKIVRYLGNHMNKHADRETTKKGVLPLAAQIPAVVGWLLRFPLQPQPDSVCVKIKLEPLPRWNPHHLANSKLIWNSSLKNKRVKLIGYSHLERACGGETESAHYRFVLKQVVVRKQSRVVLVAN